MAHGQGQFPDVQIDAVDTSPESQFDNILYSYPFSKATVTATAELIPPTGTTNWIENSHRPPVSLEWHATEGVAEHALGSRKPRNAQAESLASPPGPGEEDDRFARSAPTGSMPGARMP